MYVVPARSVPALSRSATSVSPAAASRVTNQSLWLTMPLSTVAGRDVPGPADHRRHPVGALPVGVLLVAERRHAGVRPAVHVRPVVGGVHDDRVVGEAVARRGSRAPRRPARRGRHIVSWYSDCQRPALPRLPSLTWVRKCMWVVLSQTKNGVSLVLGVGHEAQRLGDDLVVDGLHPLLGERAGVLDALGAVARWPTSG